MRRVYGAPRSRAHRVLWMLEELGLEYESVTETHDEGGVPIAELVALNPNGKIPTLVDGDTVVWESLAINLYLANRYDGGLRPRSDAQQALAVQWSLWAATEIEEPLFVTVRHRAVFPESERDPTAADAAEELLTRPLSALDTVLAKTPFLLDGGFSVADLNVASILALSGAGRVSLERFPHAARWLRQCAARPVAIDVFGRATRDAGL